MQIEYKKGDALEGPEEILAHGCNNRGVMGSGIALQIKNKYPRAYEFYRWNYSRYGLKMGEIIRYRDNDKFILNCITQNGYGREPRRYVSYEAIEEVVLGINDLAKDQSVAMPKIGAGLGGGDWNIISKIIEDNSTFQPVVYEL